MLMRPALKAEGGGGHTRRCPSEMTSGGGGHAHGILWAPSGRDPSDSDGARGGGGGAPPTPLRLGICDVMSYRGGSRGEGEYPGHPALGG